MIQQWLIASYSWIVATNIAFDSASNWGSTTATSLTYSHTVNGTNTFLYVGVLWIVWATSLVTGVTYNWVALTYIDGAQLSPWDRFAEWWYLVWAATGTHNIVITNSSSSYTASVSTSYNWVNQSWNPDNTGTTFITSGTTVTNTITSIANRCWHIGMWFTASWNSTAWTWTTSRVTNTDTHLIGIDNNASISPAGSNSIQNTRSWWWDFWVAIIGMTIKPA